MCLLPRIQLTEAMEPERHKLGADLWTDKILASNFDFQVFFVGLKFFKSAFC